LMGFFIILLKIFLSNSGYLVAGLVLVTEVPLLFECDAVTCFDLSNFSKSCLYLVWHSSIFLLYWCCVFNSNIALYFWISDFSLTKSIATNQDTSRIYHVMNLIVFLLQIVNFVIKIQYTQVIMRL
jgi:hypothetical protein